MRRSFGPQFKLFALLVLPVVLLMGLATFIRLGEANTDDIGLVIGMNRLRHAYLELAPELQPYFTTGHHDDHASILQSYGLGYRLTPSRVLGGTPAFVGAIDGQTMLEELERANLFLIPLDDERYWYRYHHLFADLLRVRLHEADPMRVPELHRKAATMRRNCGSAAPTGRSSARRSSGTDHAPSRQLAAPCERMEPSACASVAWIDQTLLHCIGFKRLLSPRLNIFQ